MDEGVVTWIAVGLVLGVLGRFAMPRRDPGGFAVPVLLGMAGALFGGFAAQVARIARPDQPLAAVAAAVGAIALLATYRTVMRRRRS